MAMLVYFSCVLSIVSLWFTIKKNWIGFLLGAFGNLGLFIASNDIFPQIVFFTYSVFCFYGVFEWTYLNNLKKKEALSEELNKHFFDF